MPAPQERVPAFQACARCGTRWQVGARPGMWCPRCQGVLLSPVSARAPAQGRRNFRWVARPAVATPAVDPSAHRASATPTPRYETVPNWGLRDIPRDPAANRPSGRVEQYAARAQILVIVTAVLLAFAAVAEALRYGILLYNRTRLVSPVTLAVSDASVFFAQIGALVTGLLALITSSCWLIRQRRATFTADRAVDPRSVRWMLALSMLPVVRIVMPGVYLTEVVRLRVRTGYGDYREEALVRIWWSVWALSNVLVIVQLLWTMRGSLQARADGVLLSAVVALVAAVSAVLTLAVMRRLDGRTLTGSIVARPTRWVHATVSEQAVSEQTGSKQTGSKQQPERLEVEQHEAVTLP